MKLSELTELLEELVPSSLAESWDNVGLLCGDPGQQIRRILVSMDLTPGILAEAKKRRADMVLLHHPPIFREKIDRLIKTRDPVGCLYSAIRSGMAVYVMHTNLDSIEGGTNSSLAEILGITTDIHPLRLGQTGRNYKLVVFVPAEHIDLLSEALFAAGAGRIGHQHRYSECSFCCGGGWVLFTATNRPLRRWGGPGGANTYRNCVWRRSSRLVMCRLYLRLYGRPIHTRSQHTI